MVARPDWASKADDGKVLDVRPFLARGVDPLAEVLTAAMPLQADGLLIVDAPFNPVPLRRLLASHGFSSFGDKVDDGHWRVWFHRDGAGESGDAVDLPDDACCGATVQEIDGCLHIDVRGLEPPLPMVAILRLINGLQQPVPVIVHHHREPLYLYPELAAIGWEAVSLDHLAGEVRLTLRQVGS